MVASGVKMATPAVASVLRYQAGLAANATRLRAMSSWTGQTDLKSTDSQVFDIIKKEKHRQVNGLELIASEVHVVASFLLTHVQRSRPVCQVDLKV